MITEEQFTKAMREAVAERGPDFVYPEEWRNENGSCRYSLEDGSPACLIGLALHKIDPDLVPGVENFQSADVVVDFAGAPMDVAQAARDAQYIQDHDGTWGDALRIYEDWLGTDNGQ